MSKEQKVDEGARRNLPTHSAQNLTIPRKGIAVIEEPPGLGYHFFHHKLGGRGGAFKPTCWCHSIEDRCTVLEDRRIGVLNG